MPNFIRNRVTERDIRDWMAGQKYDERSIVFQSVDLYAIERPGWKQLFSFQATARLNESEEAGNAESVEPNDRFQLWGVAWDDERKRTGQKTQVTLCDSEESQRELLKELSQGMLLSARDREQNPRGMATLAIGCLFLAVLFVIAMAKKYL